MAKHKEPRSPHHPQESISKHIQENMQMRIRRILICVPM
jgi:hypothetical protein